MAIFDGVLTRVLRLLVAIGTSLSCAAGLGAGAGCRRDDLQLPWAGTVCPWLQSAVAGTTLASNSRTNPGSCREALIQSHDRPRASGPPGSHCLHHLALGHGIPGRFGNPALLSGNPV